MEIDILSYYSDFYICLLSFLHNIYLRGFDLFWSLCEDQNLVYSSVWSTIPEIKTSYILPPEVRYQDQNLAHDQTVLEKCISIIKKFTSNLTVSPYFP